MLTHDELSKGERGNPGFPCAGKVAPGGIEPPHAASKAAALSTELRGLAGQRSDAAGASRSRQRHEGGGRDSNPRPPGPQPGALPTELPPPRQRHIVAAAGADSGGYPGRAMAAVGSLKQPADGADPRLDDRGYDALLVVSFGGPEGMDDVMPFLENVTRGRNVPRERLEEVAHHYERFGGVSPINRQNRDLIAALETELRAHGIDLPITSGTATGTRSSRTPCASSRTPGARRALAFFTSAFSSYSGCRQYREDLYRAQAAVGPDAPEVLKLRAFYNHPGFVEANADRVRDALAQIPEERRAAAPIVFTAH